MKKIMHGLLLAMTAIAVITYGSSCKSCNNSTTSSKCNYPRQCVPETSCEIPECCATAVECHRISEKEFKSMLTDPGSEGKFYSAEEIKTALARTTCAHRIHLERNPPDNDHIVFTVEQSAACTQLSDVHYSITLLRGILNTDPKGFYFHRAAPNGTGKDIIFSVSYDANRLDYFDYSEGNPGRGPEESIDIEGVNDHRNDN